MSTQADDPELTEQDLRAIEQADREMDNGEFIDFDKWAAEMRRKYNVPEDASGEQPGTDVDC